MSRRLLRICDALMARKDGPGRTDFASEGVWDGLRDWIDLRTDGELNAKALDILTDMMAARLRRQDAEPRP